MLRFLNRSKCLTVCAAGLSIIVAGCSEQQPPVPEQSSTGLEAAPPERPSGSVLQEATAQARAARVSDVIYDLTIDLGVGVSRFSGRVAIDFQLTDPRLPLTIDFDSGTVDKVVANGEALETIYNGSFLTIPSTALQSGGNSLEISFTRAFGKDGTGLHRFEDPEDGRVYLYTYLWPYYANQLFPLFDQPDLKAEYELTVAAPKDWIVVSTGAGKIVETADAAAIWRFDRTARIPSYVFSLHAGPYQVWEEHAGDIPLRLLARQSLAEHVAVEEWFEVTRNGLVYFGEYYGIPYPFEKYDQLIVPDFQIGAMENIAAVTFTEGTVQRQESSHAEREGRAGIILHEMAHMWFGDLVTHRWWNGLWLNESFATQMAQMALAETTEFDDAWHRFFIGGKQGAYFKDSRVTTHPIEMPIRSTDEFFSVFDAITYQKGSSVLKQLAHLVGHDAYRAGVSAYLTKHAYANTDLADFIDAIGAAAGMDLAEWSNAWLDQPGFNRVSASYDCAEGRLTRLTLKQRAHSAGPAARAHRADVALYALDGANRLYRAAVVDARFDGPDSPVDVPDDTVCPALVFANDGDWGYFQLDIDEQEREVIQNHLMDLDDPFARSMLLQTMADAAFVGDYPLDRFLDLAVDVAARESNFRVQSQATSLIQSTLTMLERLQPESTSVLDNKRPGIESLGWDKTASAENGDQRRLWFDFYLSVAGTKGALDTLRRLLDGAQSIDGLVISDDLRWQIVQRLARFGTEDSHARLATQRAADRSDLGEKMAIATEASMPDAQAKATWLRNVADTDSDLGLARQRFAMNALFPANQGQLASDLLPEVFAALRDLGPEVDPYFAARFASALLVPLCTEQSQEMYADALRQTDNLSSASLLFLREAAQADEECGRLREYF